MAVAGRTESGSSSSSGAKWVTWFSAFEKNQGSDFASFLLFFERQNGLIFFKKVFEDLMVPDTWVMYDHVKRSGAQMMLV